MQYVVIPTGAYINSKHDTLLEGMEQNSIEYDLGYKTLVTFTQFDPAYDVVDQETRQQTFLPGDVVGLADAWKKTGRGTWDRVINQCEWESADHIVITSQTPQSKEPEAPACWECGMQTVFVCEHEDGGWYYIQCEECGARGGSIHNTQQDAKAAWKGNK